MKVGAGGCNLHAERNKSILGQRRNAYHGLFCNSDHKTRSIQVILGLLKLMLGFIGLDVLPLTWYTVVAFCIQQPAVKVTFQPKLTRVKFKAFNRTMSVCV